MLNALGLEGSAKKSIVLLLSGEWPLSAKEVHSRLERQGVSVSYQAVHKSINELLSDGILEKRESDFELSKAWIQSNKSFFDGLNLRYSKAPSESTFVFNNLYEVDKFLVNFTKNALAGKEKPVVCLFWTHAWIPLFLSKPEYYEMKLLAQAAEGYSVTSGNTPVDKWCQNFWKKNNLNFKLGIKDNSIADLVVFEDVVIQVFYPREIKKELDNYFAKTKNIKDLNPEELFEKIFEKPVKIPVTITVNKVLAEELKARIKGYFKK